ncbi:MAG TPA: VOC family protein [Acidimicrobiales bacterium]|jgi:PhnB protein|nr:VOC family protein [Acidimicrobiales bacterium]
MSFSPYLFFTNNCAEAFARYHEILGGDLFMMKASEVPEGTEVPPGQPDLIIHAALNVDGNFLMASDDPTGDGGPTKGISVSYVVNDAGEAKRVFDALAEGGQVTAPLSETFFSPMFGMCVDRFGIPWMINTEAAATA